MNGAGILRESSKAAEGNEEKAGDVQNCHYRIPTLNSLH